MKKWLIDLLVCPKTKNHLKLIKADAYDKDDIYTGILATSDGIQYIIRDGIPRFVNQHYATSFGLQWNKHAITQIDNYRHTHSKQRFWGETGFIPEKLKGKFVLDGGCGAGRFTDIAASTGALVVAVDLSEAVDACYSNNKHYDNVCVIQASLFEMPFLEGTFDYAFTIGVIQHTPDPLKALACVASMVKAGGETAVSWYKKYWYTYLHQKYWLRPLFKNWSDEKLYRFVSWYVPKLLPISQALAKVIPKKLLQLEILERILPVANRDWVGNLTNEEKLQWAILDTYDWYSPQYDKPQTWKAVENVLENLGYECERTPHVRRGIHAVRSKKLQSQFI